MNEVDKNHDGSITFDEFSDCMNKVINKTYVDLKNLVHLVS